MGDGALGSDHINYLILRYLQEAGHENAAKALYQDWHRPDEYVDPERLPFAAQVKQHELVNIIQDGLFHDQLHAQVTKQSPRFNLAHPALSSRRRSSAKEPRSQPQPQPPPSSHARASQAQTQAQAQAQTQVPVQAQRIEQDDFPVPQAKRAKKTNGEQTNGELVNGLRDAADTDPKAQEDADSNDGPTDTDRAMSDAEPATVESGSVPLIETSSTATQTDKKAKPRLETMYWTLDQPESSIMHAMWNPAPQMTTRLLTVGESLCRFYHLPTPDHGGAQHTSHVDAEAMPKGSVVTAAAWHPSGRYATFAVESPKQVNGSQETMRHMFDASAQGGKRLYDMNDYVLQQAAIIVALRYNHAGSRILSVSTNMKRGLVEVWETSDSPLSMEPAAVRLFSKPVIDAVWASENSLIVCGDSHLAIYRLQDSSASDKIDARDASVNVTAAQNLTLQYSFETDKQWDKVRYDATHQVLCANSLSDDCIMLLVQQNDEWVPLPGFPADGTASRRATAMAFEPLADATGSPSDLPRRFAAAYESGLVHVHAITRTACKSLLQLSMGSHEAALALAWAPAGKLLAVASEEIVKVWDVEDSTSPVLTWRAAPAHWDHNDDNNLSNGDETGDEPSLSWDAEGKRLVFAVGRKMAVINILEQSKPALDHLKPALDQSKPALDQDTEMNGA